MLSTMTGSRRQVGRVVGAISVISLLIVLAWPAPKTYHEILAFPWFYGGFTVLSFCGSIVAGRLTSTRWYYIAMFWVACALTSAFVICIT
jgi:hypothetical protein